MCLAEAVWGRVWAPGMKQAAAAAITPAEPNSARSRADVTGPVSAGTRLGHHIARETQYTGMYACPHLAQSQVRSHAGTEMGSEIRGSSAPTHPPGILHTATDSRQSADGVSSEVSQQLRTVVGAVSGSMRASDRYAELSAVSVKTAAR